jgi:hypothetical protein
MILFDSVEGLFDDQAGDFDDGGVVNTTVTITGLESTSAIGTVSAAGVQSPTQSLTGQEATSAVSTITATGTESRTAEVTGQSATASVGTALAIGEGDAIATVPSVSATSEVGSATVLVETTRKGRKRNAKFLQFNPIPVGVSISAVAKSGSVESIADLTLVEAAGGFSGRAKLYAVKAQTDIQKAIAGGIMNPTDEEVIFLLAA